MNDRELLELAAKAAGKTIITWELQCGVEVAILEDQSRWQPLRINPATDYTGDALRLAVKLGMQVSTSCYYDDGRRYSLVEIWPSSGESRSVIKEELHNADPVAATCRAIVRVAAEIWKCMK